MPSVILSDNGVSSGSAGLKSTAASDGALALQTTTLGGTATTAVTIDTSQNVGVGVTPSAWSTFKGMQLVGGSLMSFSNAYVDLWQNSYYDGSNVRYVNTGYASYYRQNSGQHQWFTAASGTGGNVATFAQAMTLDASGNLGIGETSPAARIDLKSAATDFTGLILNNTSTNGKKYNIVSAGSGSYFDIPPGAFGIRDLTAGATRMVIDSSGRLLVGTTAVIGNSEKMAVSQSDNGSALVLYNGSASQTSPLFLTYANRNTTNNSFYVMQYYNSAAGNTRFLIADSGNVTNTNGSYGAISDAKLKENVTDTTPKLEKLNQVRVVNYNLIGEQQKQIGVIAQELEAIFPSMVEELPDRDQEGNDLGTTTKSVKYSVFVPMLIKAIQEQQAIIEQLKARLDAANL